MSLLSVDHLSVAYGDLFAVRDVSFAVEDGAVFVLLGANGAGKTSILRTISGLIPARAGTISADGKMLNGMTPHQVARMGISHVPEGRRVFPNLTVEDNLTVSFLPSRTSSNRAHDRRHGDRRGAYHQSLQAVTTSQRRHSCHGYLPR